MKFVFRSVLIKSYAKLTTHFFPAGGSG